MRTNELDQHAPVLAQGAGSRNFPGRLTRNALYRRRLLYAETVAMSINIKNKEADRLLAELKRATGKGASELILDLLRTERARITSEGAAPAQREEVERILAATREMQRLWRESPVIDTRTPDEILGYDENGLPG